MMFNITRSNYLALWYITNEMSIMDALHHIALLHYSPPTSIKPNNTDHILHYGGVNRKI